MFDYLVLYILTTNIPSNYPQAVHIFQNTGTILHLWLNPSSVRSCFHLDWLLSAPALVIYCYKFSGLKTIHTYYLTCPGPEVYAWHNLFSIQVLTGLKSRWWPGLCSHLRHRIFFQTPVALQCLVVTELRPPTIPCKVMLSTKWLSASLRPTGETLWLQISLTSL